MERKVNNVEMTRGDKISYATYKKQFIKQQKLGYIDSSWEMMSPEFYADRRHKGSFSTALEAIDQVRHTPASAAHKISMKVKKEMKRKNMTSLNYEGNYLVDQKRKKAFKGVLDISNSLDIENTISRLKGYEVYAIFYQLFGDEGIEMADEYYGY